jgi:23S rRNA (pseudouridine1915-N3)-methyltransferase
LRIAIAAVGRCRDPAILALTERWLARAPWPARLVEIQPRSNLPPERRKDEEARLLLAAVAADALIVALDERGEPATSHAFAQRLARLRHDRTRDLAFLIGGAEGHGAAVLARAGWRLSLGPMTWPHLLVRVLLAEQLYRAGTILARHPYHRA